LLKKTRKEVTQITNCIYSIIVIDEINYLFNEEGATDYVLNIPFTSISLLIGIKILLLMLVITTSIDYFYYGVEYYNKFHLHKIALSLFLKYKKEEIEHILKSKILKHCMTTEHFNRVFDMSCIKFIGSRVGGDSGNLRTAFEIMWSAVSKRINSKHEKPITARDVHACFENNLESGMPKLTANSQLVLAALCVCMGMYPERDSFSYDEVISLYKQ